MDGKRFDALTKSVALGSRRSLFKAIVGVLSGAAVGAVDRVDAAMAAAGRAPGQICRKNGDCASRRCGPPDFSGRSVCLCGGSNDCPAPGNKCDVSVCSQTGQCVTTSKNCDDNNPCTIDSCDRDTGRCVHVSKNCDDRNACTRDSCDVATGNCVNTPISCNDGNACTVDTCDPAKGCVNTPRTCAPLNQCHTAGCNTSTGCYSTPKADDTECDDGDPDTCNDICTGGVCAGTAVDFGTDDDNCGSCGNVCTSDEICSAGECVSLCAPNCAGKNCGDDGCGGVCGTCSFGNECNTATGVCACAPNCSGKTCGSDGCGGSCGECQGNVNCISGTCVPCLADGTQCIGASCITCCHSTKRNGYGNFYCGCVPEGVQCISTPNGPGTDVNCLNCCTPLNAGSGTCPGVG